MPRIRIEVDVPLVQKMLSDGVKTYSIEKRIGVPRSVSEDIGNGIMRSFFMRNIKREEPKEGICHVCGFKPIYPGFRFLCLDCWRESDDDVFGEYAIWPS